MLCRLNRPKIQFLNLHSETQEYTIEVEVRGGLVMGYVYQIKPHLSRQLEVLHSWRLQVVYSPGIDHLKIVICHTKVSF